MVRTRKAGLAQGALAMPRPPHKLRTAAAALAAIVVWLSPARAAEDPSELLALKRAVVAHYGVLVHATYEDALGGVRNLARTVDAFLEAPSADSLDRARKAWIHARVPYAQTEAYRFYDGPIEAVEGLINAWPIDENLIDYVEGEPDAGVINQVATFPDITGDLIASLNEKGGEKNITAGFHAIEFLLWGQDLTANGPGQRPYLDYVVGKGTHADRRREYLRLAVRLLEQNLAQVLDEWAPARQDNYRARLIAMPPDAALASMLQGIGILSGSELAGERLTVAYETKEQEDEHSCFSDNTQSDVLYNVIGIRNVFLGRYAVHGEPVEGPAFRDLLMRVNPSLAETLTRQIDASVAAAEAVPAPFDRAIYTNHPAWAQTVVWGNRAVWGNTVVWGNSTVWDGNAAIWGNTVVWGNSLIGQTTGSSTTWGSLSSNVTANTVVWGNLQGLQIAPTSISWANLERANGDLTAK